MKVSEIKKQINRTFGRIDTVTGSVEMSVGAPMHASYVAERKELCRKLQDLVEEGRKKDSKTLPELLDQSERWYIEKYL